MQANARFQEGEEPTEDANALLTEADRVLSDLEDLIRRINRTNAVATLNDATTLTDALARRDALRLRHSLWAKAADAASGRSDALGSWRQLRSELRTLPALPVRELRATVDDLARQHRELDVRIQRGQLGGRAARLAQRAPRMTTEVGNRRSRSEHRTVCADGESSA